MKNKEIDPVLIRCIEGNASEVEYASVWEWIQESRENRIYYERLRDTCLSVAVFSPDQSNAGQAWASFNEKYKILTSKSENSRSRIVLLRFLRVAAMLILTFLLGGVSFQKLLHHGNSKNNVENYLIEAPRGAKSLINMPDGSKIWLNAGSRISYNQKFNIASREINLEGEAYFVVAKNQKLPFYVRSSGITIKAIGTAFNVKAYPEEDKVETTLIEGSISIESLSESGKKERILLKPNEKASFYKSTEAIKPVANPIRKEPILSKKETRIAKVEIDNKIEADYYTSWKDKRWVFKEQNLSDFAVVLERIYDVKITFKDEALKNYRLSGSFDEVNIEQVLDAVRLTVPLDYSIEQNTVVFSLNRKLKSNYDNLLKKRNR